MKADRTPTEAAQEHRQAAASAADLRHTANSCGHHQQPSGRRLHNRHAECFGQAGVQEDLAPHLHTSSLQNVTPLHISAARGMQHSQLAIYAASKNAALGRDCILLGVWLKNKVCCWLTTMLVTYQHIAHVLRRHRAQHRHAAGQVLPLYCVTQHARHGAIAACSAPSQTVRDLLHAGEQRRRTTHGLHMHFTGPVFLLPQLRPGSEGAASGDRLGDPTGEAG